MTINSQVADWEWTASGSSPDFAINEPLPDPDRIAACLYDPATGQITAPPYTVAANADFSGGILTFQSNPASGLRPRAWRIIDGRQRQPLPTFGPLPAKAVERVDDLAAVDRLAARRFITRTVRVPDDEGAITPLPRIVDRKGKVLGFDGNGNPVASQVSIDGVLEAFWCGIFAGTPNALSATLTPPITTYAAGQTFHGKTGAVANTGPVTFASNGLSPLPLTRSDGAALVDGDLPANTVIRFTCDGAGLRLVGVQTATTPAKTDNSTKLATTHFVKVRETWVNAYDKVDDPVASDWTAYMNAAVTALPSGGGCVKWPGGTVPMASGLPAISNKNIRIHGFGVDVSRISFSHPSQSCFTIAHGSNGFAAEVSDLTIIANGVMNGAAAIDLQMPAAYVETMTGPLVRNVAVRGATWATDQFIIAVALTNCLRARLENVVFSAKQKTVTAVLAYLVGSANKHVTIFNCGQSYGEALLKTDGGGYFMEGIHVIGCRAVATNWLASINNNMNGPDFTFRDNHGECFLGGIFAQAAPQLYASGNKFYKRDSISGEPAPANYTAFSLSACPDFDISNNFGFVVDLADNTGDKFLNAVNSDGGVAAHCIIDGFDVGFDGNGNSDMDIVAPSYRNTTTLAQNITAASRVKDPIPDNGTGVAMVSFAANAATPSVGNTYAPMFFTNNSGATTITNFLNFYNGQEFWLLVNDANTTIQHNANIILKGGVNATPATGSIFRFYRDSLGAWREMSRNY